MNDRETIRVRAGDAELAVVVQGRGAPVLFVHGFPFDHTMWRHQLTALTRWRRIALDLRGAGGSGGAAETTAGYADDLVAVLEALDVPRAVVCGHSMGGYVVFELLRRRPERVRAVILCATKPEADSAEGRRARDELAALAEREGPEAVAARLLPKLLGSTTHARRPHVVEEARAMVRRFSVAGMVGALRAMRERADSTETLRALGLPTLVLGGAEDEISPPPVIEAMAALVPGAETAIVPEAGHLVPLEQPLATSRALARFLEAVT